MVVDEYLHEILDFADLSAHRDISTEEFQDAVKETLNNLAEEAHDEGFDEGVRAGQLDIQEEAFDRGYEAAIQELGLTTTEDSLAIQ